MLNSCGFVFAAWLACLGAAQAKGEMLAAQIQAPEPSLPPTFLSVPLVRQTTSYDCGPAALLSVLKYWKAYDGSETALFARLETTPKDGTEPLKLAEGARGVGLRASVRTGLTLGDLRLSLSQGETAILDIQAWREPPTLGIPWKNDWEDGHYVVLIAMDKEFAYLMDPSVSGSYGYLPLEELLDRWHDYEDRHGPRQVYDHSAVLVLGKTPLRKGSAQPLVRVQ